MSKRAWPLVVTAALLVVMSGGAAFAIPSLDGPTGIVSVPNALVAPTGQMQGALSWQAIKVTESTAMYGGSDTDSFSDWSVQVLGGVSNGAELWAAYSNANDDLNTSTWSIGGKLQFAQEPREQATLAIGGSFQQGSGDFDHDVNVSKLYLAATKDVTPSGLSNEWAASTRFLATAGVLWASADAGSDFDDSLVEPFLGAEFVTAGGTSLGLEYRWKDSSLDTDGVFSATVRHCFEGGIVGEIGTTNADQFGLGTGNQDLFVRVGYSTTVASY
jgi:hypothetical protein